ncbi:MAG: hypothetical protein M1836_004916 [Candelina mexicana]|nr:MAG: hypothetical protein M1836_004916 [Candelina mexicana]
MSDVPSEADKIRNKRLAKLGNQAPVRTEETGESAPSPVATSQPQPSLTSSPDDALRRDTSAQSKPKINTSSPSTAATSTSNPFSQLGMSSRITNGATPRINISPAGSQQSKPVQRPDSRAKSSSESKESAEAWEDKILGGIFRLTLRSETLHDTHGHNLHYVPGVKEDLEDQGERVRLSTGVLDQAILEAASNLENTNPLDYLLACWKRVSRQLRGMKISSSDPKYTIMKEARRICMSYCMFAATMPDMFGREPTSVNSLTQHLLVDPEDDRGICHDFLTEAISRFEDDESTKDALVEAVIELSRQLASMSMNDDYKPYVLALRNAARFPALVNALVQSSHFLDHTVAPQDIEKNTLLGPYFQISPLQGDVTTQYFSSPKTRDRGYIINSQRALRLTLQTHQTELLEIVNNFLRASTAARERILDWFAFVVNANHKRRAMQVDQKAVASDGFMVNLTTCLDQLCEPFMDARFSKIDRIDVDYLRRHPRVDIREETKINADQSTSDRFYEQTVGGTSNFISEVFFLTLAAHHYGTEAANTKLGQLEKDLKHMEKQIEKFELERHKFVNHPAQLKMFEAHLKKYKDQIDRGLSYKYAVQGVLLDDLSQARSMQFMRYVIVWLLRLVTPGLDFPRKPLSLPLQEEQSEVFKCLPEYFLEIVVDNFKFTVRNMPQILSSTQSDELVMLCITFLRSSEYIKNPYLKSGLVTILFYGIWETYGRKKGILGDALNSLPFATEHLLHALMKFYIEAENTGTHTQFFDKFHIRYEIFKIIDCVWSNTIYRERLAQEAKLNLDFFVRFVNLLLNDVTFVLDESLTAFTQIHDLQNEVEDSSLDQAARTEKEEALAQAEGKAKSYMELTNQTVAMLKLFTEALAESFTMPEIVQRLADMLDYNLDVMVGPKSQNLVVRNPAQYDFRPKILLSQLVDVYLNLREKENFHLAVARDGRSYKPANFEKATKILGGRSVKSADELALWTTLCEKFKAAKEADDQAEEDLGEVPEDFLDPLMYTLMEDPVFLPTSKISIDRSTIRSHLLSDPNDPFNRAPLKIEEVVPDTDLKARIQAFKAEKKGKRTVEGGGGEMMDTSTG